MSICSKFFHYFKKANVKLYITQKFFFLLVIFHDANDKELMKKYLKVLKMKNFILCCTSEKIAVAINNEYL